MAEDRPFPSFVDERGSLLAVEFADVPFDVRRVFVVRGTSSRLPRGDHDVPCHELVVLLSGAARFEVVSPGGTECTSLEAVGERLLLRPGHRVSYVLDGPESAIMVLASAAYEEGP